MAVFANVRGGKGFKEFEKTGSADPLESSGVLWSLLPSFSHPFSLDSIKISRYASIFPCLYQGSVVT